jgi:excisionase family DNA binding protein
MSEISPTEAIKLTGKARQTIYDAMEKGDLSFKQVGPRKRLIDIAELERWNRGLKSPEELAASEDVQSGQNQTSVKDVELEMLKQQIDMLKSERQREREQYEDQVNPKIKTKGQGTRKRNLMNWLKPTNYLENKTAAYSTN